MDALRVWETWRRLLTDDDLVAWIREPDPHNRAPDGLTADETAILIEYSSTPEATRSNIGMYRRGLMRNALGALDLVPLTHNLLRASDLDEDAVAKQFSRASGYHDFGPRFWHAAAAFVDFLADLPEFASAAHQDVLALDRATIELALRLGASRSVAWPGPGGEDAAGQKGQVHEHQVPFVATVAATTISTSCDITPWIENPFEFDAADSLELTPLHVLVYFPSAEDGPEYALVSARAAAAFEALSSPHDADGLSAAIDGLTPEDAKAVLGELMALGVVARAAHLLEAAATR